MVRGNIATSFGSDNSLGRVLPFERYDGVPVVVTEQKSHESDTCLAKFIAEGASLPVEISTEETVGESGMEGKLILERMNNLDNKLETCQPICAEVLIPGLPQLLGKNSRIFFDVPKARLNLVVLVLHLWQFCNLLAGTDAIDVHYRSQDASHVLQPIDCRMLRAFLGGLASKCSEIADICETLARCMDQMLWNMSDDNTCCEQEAFCRSGSVNFESNQPCALYTGGMFRPIAIGKWHCLRSLLNATCCMVSGLSLLCFFLGILSCSLCLFSRF